MLTFDPVKHEYRVGRRVLPSVTQVVGELYGGAFDKIPPDVLERKRTLGQALHLATQLLDEGRLDEATVDPAIAPYLAAYRKAHTERQFKWEVIERPEANTIFGFAGTIDRVGYVKDIGQALVDFKTVATLHPAVGVQLAGYARLLNMRGIRRFALQLLPSGEYRMVEFKDADDDAAFMACLALHNWRQKRAA